MKEVFMVSAMRDLRTSIAVLVLKHIEFYGEPTVDELIDLSEAFRMLHVTGGANSIFKRHDLTNEQSFALRHVFGELSLLG